MNLFEKLATKLRRLDSIEARCDRIQEALGRIEARQLASVPTAPIAGAEFRTFSQWGEDGIIQHLIRRVRVDRKVFVEFGTQDYSEANTRFLLVNDNWSGLIIDGSQPNIDRVVQSDLYWRHNLKAVCAFVTRENIDELIRGSGLSGDIGLLSVDIDGNDYWVWEAITSVSPAIVVVEYNWRFGPERSVTTPYDPRFERSHAHHSMIYYGASLAALCTLGRRKGYGLVGCNSAGNNAFFVRDDLRPTDLPVLTSKQGFVAGKFREARGADGTLAFMTAAEEEALVASLPLVEIPEAA